MAGIQIKNQVTNQFGAPSINENTLANRPNAGQVGRLFVDTTNNLLYRDNGTSWDLIGASTPATPSLQDVCAVGNTYTGDVYFNSIRIGHGGPTSVATNTLVGQGGLNAVNSAGAINNVAMGRDSLTNLTSASNSTSIGYQSGYSVTTSTGNTFIGSLSGKYTTGGNNTLIGYNTDTGNASFPNLFALSNTIIGANNGTGINNYTSNNTFIGYNTTTGYVGSGINGINTFIGANQNWASIPTAQGYATISDGAGSIKYMRFPTGNTNIGGTTDNGIQVLQINGGLYASTIALTGTTWATNTTISSASTANYYYVYTGAGAGNITLPTASGNNNIYVFINATNMTHTISTTGGQFILQKNIGTSVTSLTNSMYGSIMLIADGNNKFYQIVN